MICVTAAATPTMVITFMPSSLPELTATTDNPLASHPKLSLNLNLGTTGLPPSIHQMLPPNPRVRADRCETHSPTLHQSITTIDRRRGGADYPEAQNYCFNFEVTFPRVGLHIPNIPQTCRGMLTSITTLYLYIQIYKLDRLMSLSVNSLLGYWY